MKSRKRAKSPPSWLVEGAMVDYHAVIGEPATQFNMRARTSPQQMDSGHWVVWLEGKSGSVSVDACTPATGSLGPSSDDLAIDARVDWPSLDGEEQDGWHERAIEWLRTGGAQ